MFFVGPPRPASAKTLFLLGMIDMANMTQIVYTTIMMALVGMINHVLFQHP